MSVTARANTKRETAAGTFETYLALKWQKSRSDDTRAGALTVDDAFVALAGIKVGYTDSLMNFWDGDFQFSATVPKRNVATLSYEREILPDNKLTVALESGVPTSRGSDTALVSVSGDDPVVAARWHYEKDDYEIQASGLLHELKSGGAALPFGLTAPQGRVPGYAATLGITIPAKFFGDEDALSAQATYARNASPYLGTAVDLSTFASIVPVPVETRGWSAVVSFHHEWTESFETNVFVSRLHLDLAIGDFSPSAGSTRYAANIKWKPLKKLTVGAELGYLRLKADSGVGAAPAASGRSLTGTLFSELEF